MKFIRFFIVAVVAMFGLQFSTASAATTVKVAGTSLQSAKTTTATHRHVRHRARHFRRIHRHKR